MIEIFQDALFAAIAAIGFAAISRPPVRLYAFCALVAAIGHSCRYVLMDAGLHILPATLIAAFVLGTFAVLLSPIAKTPAEACLFPALLPMIPGIYAYRAFGALGACVLRSTPDSFNRYFYLFAYNSLTCTMLILAMVVGATLPVFLFKKVSFRATR